MVPTRQELFQQAERAQRAGDLDGAEAGYRAVLKQAPRALAALANLAAVMEAGGRYAESLDLLKRAHRVAPNEAPIALNLAIQLERAGELRAAGRLVRRLLTAKDPGLRARTALIAARLARADGAFDAALEHLKPALAAPDPVLRAQAEYERAGTIDRAGGADRAEAVFAALETAKGLQREAFPQWRTRADAYRAEVRRNAELAAEPPRAWRPETPLSVAPVFFVGFPRSGTTVMERHLDLHPRTVTTGEVSPLAHMLAKAGAALGTRAPWPDVLAGLDDPGAERLRALFDAEVRRLGLAEDGTPDAGSPPVMIDKLPFNLVDLPTVRRLFPEAKVILALRDPRDACLSCYMQPFLLNDANANFLTLETTGALYDAALSVGAALEASGGLDTFTYRYEDFVAEPAAILADLCAHLGIEPDDAMLNAEGRRGAYIATPSQDAREALHARALARWERFAASLAPILPVLAPWIARFGYPADVGGDAGAGTARDRD